MRNIGLKFASIAIAVLLAYFVNSEMNQSEISFFVPIEVSNRPADKIIVWPLTRQAQVTVSGPSFISSRVAASPPSFKVRLPSDIDSRYSVTLQKRDLPLPPSIELRNIVPSEIEFVFDDKVSKEIPVEVPLLGALDENLKLEEVVLSPSVVTVSGPETEVQEIAVAQGSPIDLKDIRETSRRDISVRVGGKLTELSTNVVTAEVRVSPVQEDKNFESVPIEIRARDSRSYKIRPLEVGLEVTGPRAIIEELTASEVLPFVRLGRDTRKNDKVDIEVELPRGVSVKSIQPRRVTIAEIH